MSNNKPQPMMDALRASNGEKPLDEQPDVQIIDADDVEERAPPTDSQLKNVRDLAADLYRRKKAIAELMEQVAEHTVAIGVLEEKSIPAAMQAIGMDSFSLTGGFRVDLEKYRHGSVTKANEPAFFEWLENNNFGSIIKHVLTISFGKGEDKWAKKFMADLAKRKVPIPCERKDGVHAQTLKSFFKERFELEEAGKVPEDKRVPRDVVTVHEGIRATLFDPTQDAADKARRAGKKKAKGEVEM